MIKGVPQMLDGSKTRLTMLGARGPIAPGPEPMSVLLTVLTGRHKGGNGALRAIERYWPNVEKSCS
jgi:hypothetical protein